jgi:acetyl-CoA C-acetyltransferase
MFDVALRARHELGIDAHRERISRLWSRFSEVAATNPNAWIQKAYSPEEIGTPSPDNRMVGYPYTKLMNSNNMVEQGAALLIASVEKARDLGVPADRWVFIHAGAEAHDHWYVSNRADLCSSPAIRFAGRRLFELGDVGPDDLDHVDLYSCFPSAVQIAAEELGLSLARDLTVTGGMSFAGGPWNNYPMNGIATMSDRLRESPGAVCLCTANGGYTTKHALGLYATKPPVAGTFMVDDVQAEVDATPSRQAIDEYDGTATIESYTVMHGRDGRPEQGLGAGITPDGARVWWTSNDADTMQALLAEEWVGKAAKVFADGRVEL